jgi:hypothetical protein
MMHIKSIALLLVLAFAGAQASVVETIGATPQLAAGGCWPGTLRLALSDNWRCALPHMAAHIARRVREGT